jgi:hypothetical protein
VNERVISTPVSSGPPTKIDSPQIEFLEDPLLASVMGYGMVKPQPAPAPSEPAYIDKVANEHIVSDTESEDDELEDDTPKLLVHTRIYAIADK